ncbi:DUF4369 domain-containing protein [Winogradskyella sp. A3E31]|uniref:DUF4369 domain-containing protein n=1 Tax=Winogradskyella sp. A3E31 TaxID=3349637 RepID=UPI00398B5D26
MLKSLKTYVLAILILGVVSCDKKEANFTLKGSIKGLKKGTVYLQKDGDSSRITLDSMQIMGEPEFVLSTDLEEPILLFLKLAKNDNIDDNVIPFFADKGEMQIKTTLKRFSFDAKITGSQQQEVLEDYLEIVEIYKDQNLDLIKHNFDAQKRQDSVAVDSLNKRYERLTRLKYAATINFALNHNDSEVAPYLAVYEIPNTSVKYMDSIYNNLTSEIKESHYGKILGDALRDYRTALDTLN